MLHIFIEHKNRKKNQHWPKEPLATARKIILGQLAIGQRVQQPNCPTNGFPFFYRAKKKFTPQNDVVLGRYRKKKDFTGQSTSASRPVGHGLCVVDFSPAHLSLSPPFFALREPALYMVLAVFLPFFYFNK